jgi:hypothetical protein
LEVGDYRSDVAEVAVLLSHRLLVTDGSKDRSASILAGGSVGIMTSIRVGRPRDRGSISCSNN